MANASSCSGTPHVELANGVLLPMVAYGHRDGKGLDARVDAALAAGLCHFDTAEVYRGRRELASLLRKRPRASFFLTAKIDPTMPRTRRRECRADGGGCEAIVARAADALATEFGGAPIDLLLLHRPPLPQKGDDAAAQCTRARALWRGMVAAVARGRARAHGVSNFCVPLLRCLVGDEAGRVHPHVVSGMLHVGMGADPLGYLSWAREHGAVFQAYSVLGGVEGDLQNIVAQPAVARIAAAHGTSAAAVAMRWVAQRRLPFVTHSSSVAHLRDNLRLFDDATWAPSGRALSDAEVRALDSVGAPAGSPSHWGECTEGGGTSSPSARPGPRARRDDGWGRPRTAGDIAGKLAPAVARLCGGVALPRVGWSAERQACEDAERLQNALAEVGARSRVTHRADEAWEPLEGAALLAHPDPLGALQRGEVPALVLRGLVPPDELRHMLTRMAEFGQRRYDCARSANGLERTSPQCALFFRGDMSFLNSRKHWCTLLSNLAYDCGRNATANPRCKELVGHEFAAKCHGGKELGKAAPVEEGGARPSLANEFGLKMYSNMQHGNHDRYLRHAHAINTLYNSMAEGCVGRWCSPHQAMLYGLRQLAAAGGGAPRTVGLAAENATKPSASARPVDHSPGTIRVLHDGWTTPLHMDSKHSNAWVALRKELCGESVPLGMRTSPREVTRFQAIARNRFAASAILTLHAPERETNPHDLRVYRTRWPALLGNCSVRTADAYGVGARFVPKHFPQHVLRSPLLLRGDPGDLFLFNSEYFHDTPKVVGASTRTVFNSFASYSAHSGDLELYG